MQEVPQTSAPHIMVVRTDGTTVEAELPIILNQVVEVNDAYLAPLGKGDMAILRVTGFKSAADYTPVIERATEAVRQGVVSPQLSPTAQRAYQRKLALLEVEGELRADGTRRFGAFRVPDVLTILSPIDDEAAERFGTDADGNTDLGNLRIKDRVVSRRARIRHTYPGDRMVVYGNTGVGKTSLVRSIQSQEMAHFTENDLGELPDAAQK